MQGQGNIKLRSKHSLRNSSVNDSSQPQTARESRPGSSLRGDMLRSYLLEDTRPQLNSTLIATGCAPTWHPNLQLRPEQGFRDAPCRAQEATSKQALQSRVDQICHQLEAQQLRIQALELAAQAAQQKHHQTCQLLESTRRELPSLDHLRVEISALHHHIQRIGLQVQDQGAGVAKQMQALASRLCAQMNCKTVLQDLKAVENKCEKKLLELHIKIRQQLQQMVEETRVTTNTVGLASQAEKISLSASLPKALNPHLKIVLKVKQMTDRQHNPEETSESDLSSWTLDEEEILYYVDPEGYLLDRNYCYLLDSHGQHIQVDAQLLGGGWQLKCP